MRIRSGINFLIFSILFGVFFIFFKTPPLFAENKTPLEVTTGVITSSSVEIMWTSGNGNEIYFVIERSTDGPFFTNIVDDAASIFVARVPASTHSYLVENLAPNVNYRFKVAAGNGKEPLSAYAITPQIFTLAQKIVFSHARVDSQNQITIFLSLMGNRVGTEFFIKNVTDKNNSGWTQETSYAFTNLACGTQYKFRVKARNAVKVETSFSDTLSAMTSACGEAPLLGAKPVSIVENSLKYYSDNSGKVILRFNVKNASQMSIVENASLSGSKIPWKPYRSRFVYKIGEDMNRYERTLYIRFRSKTGGESPVQIILIPLPPDTPSDMSLPLQPRNHGPTGLDISPKNRFSSSADKV